MTFSHVFFYKKEMVMEQKERDVRCWVTKKFREVVAKKYVSKTLIKKIAHPIHLQKCRRTECIELSGRLSRNM